MVFVSRNSASPAAPISLPIPDCLYPPNGASGANHDPPLTPTVPVRIRRATAIARSVSAPIDAPGETEDGVVGDPDRVVVIVVRDHHEHRTEQFLLRNLAIGVDMVSNVGA